MDVPAKISRPRLAAVYQRTRLLEQLEAVRAQHAATFVSGQPGSGKSTLVSSYIEFRNLRCIWYQVDAGDDDIGTFFHFLLRAAERHLPGKGGFLPRFESERTHELISFSRAYFRRLYDALEAPFILVLDNYQDLPENSRLHQAVRIACEELPKKGHIMMLSRDRCPKEFARMRLCRALTVIEGSALDLTPQETIGVAALRGVALPSAATAAALHEKAGGWMAGLMLLLEQNGAVHRSQDVGTEPIDILSDYFEGEVFGALAESSRDFLLQGALLPCMTLSSITQLTGSPAAGALLRKLTRRNLFITRHGADASTYQFHPLFRQFLLVKGVARYPTQEYRSLCTRAAEILAADGEYDAAMELLAQVCNWQGMANMILVTAPDLREQGRHATLETRIRKLPSALVSGTPWLLYWQGLCHSRTCPEQGLANLEQAYRLFAAAGDSCGMGSAWSALVDAICTMSRDFRQLDPWIDEFDAQLCQRLVQMAPPVQAGVTIGMFVALSYRRPLRPDFMVWLERTRRLMETDPKTSDRSSLRQRLVIHHVSYGQMAEAEMVLSLFPDVTGPPPASDAGAILSKHASEAMFALHAGLDQRCLQAVSAGLLAARENGVRTQDAILLCHGAMMCLNRGDLACVDRFLDEFKQLSGTAQAGSHAHYYAAMAWRKFHAGELMLAVRFCALANACAQAQGLSSFIAACDLGAGMLLHLCGDTKKALAHLEAGRQIGFELRNSAVEYAYRLFAASIAFDMRDEEQAREHLAVGMQIGRQHGLMHFPFFPPQIIAQLCCRALEAGIETAYVCALIDRNKLQPASSWRQIECWPWPLRIYTLGRFSVVRAGAPIQFSGKSQKKPLELLRALIALGGRDVPEARLEDALWPDAEGDAAAQTLATTLFRLRKLIGEHVIRRQDNRLTLDPALCWVDCWTFERLSSEDAMDRTTLAKLGKLYQGPFLAGEEAAPWAVPMRERLRIRFDRCIRLQGVQSKGSNAAAA